MTTAALPIFDRSGRWFVIVATSTSGFWSMNVFVTIGALAMTERRG